MHLTVATIDTSKAESATAQANRNPTVADANAGLPRRVKRDDLLWHNPEHHLDARVLLATNDAVTRFEAIECRRQLDWLVSLTKHEAGGHQRFGHTIYGAHQRLATVH